MALQVTEEHIRSFAETRIYDTYSPCGVMCVTKKSFHYALYPMFLQDKMIHYSTRHCHVQ